MFEYHFTIISCACISKLISILIRVNLVSPGVIPTVRAKRTNLDRIPTSGSHYGNVVIKSVIYTGRRRDENCTRVHAPGKPRRGIKSKVAYCDFALLFRA